jgi:hypothetical protein
MQTLGRLLFICQSLVGGAALMIGGSDAARAADYHLVKRVVLGGEGGWDYFKADPVTHHVFIARGAHLMVLDPDGKVVQDVTGIKGSHAVEFAPDLKRIFTSNGGAGSVTILDQDTLRIIADVKIPNRDTDAILYEPITKRVFAFNGADGHDATAIDAKTGEILGNIPLGGKPESVGINRHVVGDERALQERRTANPSWPRVLRAAPRGVGRSVDRGISGRGY